MNSALLIDGKTLRQNLRIFRSFTQSRILQVVKANAYGHGLNIVARELIDEGVDALGVVNIDEAKVVRELSSEVPIFLLGVVPFRDYKEALSLGCILPVWRLDQVRLAHEIACSFNLKAVVQVKVDTGMGRLGILPDELSAFLEQAVCFSNVSFSAIYTHFSAADSIDTGSYKAQFERFSACVVSAKRILSDDILVHVANSPAFLRDTSLHLDMVRIGIAGFGISPDPSIKLLAGIKPVASWISSIENVKVLPPGHGVSYGSEFVTNGPLTVGVVPVGYADGFHRVPKDCNSIVVRGKLVRVLGRICMDHFVVDLSGISEPSVGEEVLLMGQDDSLGVSATALASRWGTNEYDVMCNIGQRVERRLLNGGTGIEHV